MIKVFLDTNILYSDKNKIFNKVEFGGEYKRIIKKIALMNKYSRIVNIYIPEIAVLEFKHNCLEEYEKQKLEVDNFNKKLESIFGNNLIHKSKLSWNSIHEYSLFLDSEMNKYINENSNNFQIIPTPDCLDEIISKAISKKPLFKEAKCGSKIYYDAGLKDNLILETCIKYLDNDDVGIIYTRDTDFSVEIPNLYVARTMDEFDENIKILCPDYTIYRILDEIDCDNKKIDILSFLELDYDSTIEIINFSNEICEYDEEDDILSFLIIATINGEEKRIYVSYNMYMRSIVNVELK